MGVCAPAGAVEGDRLEAGVAELESLGFRVQVPQDLLRKTGYTAGDVHHRIEQLHALFAEDAVKAIVCARGGAGAGRLLPLIDRELLAARPKVFVGYSDITFLHLLLARAGVISFHGPMVARDLAKGDYHRASFLHALTGEGAPYATAGRELMPLRPGTGQGRLRGGCLSILAAAVGTPWAPIADEEGTVLLLEDVDERPYRIERMLQQLARSGALQNVRGIVFGQMLGCAPGEAEGYCLEEVILEALEGLDMPIAFGFASGHASGGNVTLPFGARARLGCAAQASLEVLEPGVE